MSWHLKAIVHCCVHLCSPADPDSSPQLGGPDLELAPIWDLVTRSRTGRTYGSGSGSQRLYPGKDPNLRSALTPYILHHIVR